MISKNIKDTDIFAKIFVNKILKDTRKYPGALVVGLSGELGSGKTAFTKCVAKYLGVKGRISSPTFVIMKKYSLKKTSKILKSSNKKNREYKFFFHLDAYRLNGKKELFHLKWKEIIENRDNLVFIEWPENVRGAIPVDAKRVFISYLDKNRRNFKFK